MEPNWLLMPCSGQVYGIIGSVVLAGAALAGRAVSNHVLRIAPGKNARVREGYLLTALSHPQLGRPLIKALAFGSSVPEIDAEELRDLKVVRLDAAEEDAIADLAEESAALRAKADVLEREMAAEAGRLIDGFLAGDVVNFVVTMPAVATRASTSTASALLEHAVVCLRHGLKNDGLRKGAKGTIVHVYEGGAGYEVEFAKAGGRPKVVTVEPADIELV
ncbi:MAG: DUF4926 domain-containing protein [Verrucomicrobiaceae bacterium]|nr:DUF4926 domain-containing protein [Verrucomicrobiaceae bacterium]